MEDLKIFEVRGKFKMSKEDFEIAKNVALELAEINLYSEVEKFLLETFQNLDDFYTHDILEKFLKKNEPHFVFENLPNDEIIYYAESNGEINLTGLDDYMKNFEFHKLKIDFEELQDELENLKDNYKAFFPKIIDLTIKIRSNPNDAEAYLKRGKYYRCVDDYSKSIEDFTQAIKLNPNFVKAYNERGRSQEESKNYSQAIEDYTQAIKLNPDDAWTYFFRGNIHCILKNYEKAIEDFTKAIELNLDEDFVYSERGECYKALGKNDLAKKDFDKCNELLVRYFKK